MPPERHNNEIPVLNFRVFLKNKKGITSPAVISKTQRISDDMNPNSITNSPMIYTIIFILINNAHIVRKASITRSCYVVLTSPLSILIRKITILYSVKA